MFRRYYEAQDDGGLVVAPPGQEPVIVPQDGEPEVSAEQLIVDRINEVNAEADARESGEPASQSDIGRGGQQGSTDAQAQDATEDLILGRFKTADDVITAYQNLEPEYTQTRQQMRNLERQLIELQDQLEFANTQSEYQQQDSDFTFEAPFSEQPRNIEELEALAEQYPDRAAMFAIQNSQRLPGELVQEVLNYWHQRNPAQASAYMVHQMFQSYMPQVEQRLAPTENRYQNDIVQSAVDMAEQAIGPQYEQYHDRIIDVIEANPAFLPDDLNNAEAMRDSIINVYSMLIGRDTLQRGAQLAAQGQPQPTQQQAMTQTRPGAAAITNSSASQEDVEAARAIQNLILNAQG